MSNSGVDGLKGKWEYVDGEHFDDFMKELGVNESIRKIAAQDKAHLLISENNGKWTLRSESSINTSSYEFTPGVEFNEKTIDGRDVKSTINFQGNKWVHTTIDKDNKQSTITRYVDDKDQQMIEMKCGSVASRRWYKRAE